jgi:hypothetical protein
VVGDQLMQGHIHKRTHTTGTANRP